MNATIVKKIFTLLLLLLPVAVMGQDDEMVQVRGNVKFVNDAHERIDAPDRLFYGVMPVKQANEVELKLRDIIKDYQDKEAERELKIDELCKANQIDKRAPKGNFKTNALPTMVIIMVAPEVGEYIRINLERGKTQYKDVEKMMKQLKGITAEGKAQDIAITVGGTDDADDGYERFRVHFEIPAGTARSDSRLLVQTFAVDCQTDDTLGYGASLVYEGEVYHEKQNRRMSYNYDKNDKLGEFYRTNAVLREDRRFVLDTIVAWKKPGDMMKRDFRGPYTYVFEDFHHVYYMDGYPGSCLKRRPFKLLSFKASNSEIPLTTEFYEQAESKFEKRDRKIDLRFEMGTARLIVDSLNIATQEQLVKELRSYGSSLAQVTIVGAASPDGSMKRNEELANQRVAVAQGIVSGKIPVTPKKEVKVYTWNDVAQTLRNAQKEEQAAAVEAIIEGGGDDQTLTKRMKELPFYPLDIEPILNAQRTMRCSYMYQAKHVMTPEECVVEYYKNKKDYLEFTRHFSNGDYYNLFDMITDSLELDTITMIAYREITSEPDYQIENVISPYVCNRYAVMQAQRDNPNVEILRPFVDLKRYGNGKGGINVKQWTASRGMINWNRHEIIINQAVAYYMEQKVDTALFLVQWLRGNNIEDASLTQLENLINLKTLHFKARNATENADYERAKAAVLESDENKAILYTEIEDWDKRKEAPFWVSRMQDDNPKKWYLKGMLTALDYEKEEKPVVTPPGENSKEKKDSIGVNVDKFKDIPPYLAYFQHCFDLDPTRTYFRYYHREYNVSEKLRAKYKYKLKNRDLYRQMFDLLKKRDDMPDVTLPGDDAGKQQEGDGQDDAADGGTGSEEKPVAAAAGGKKEEQQ
mgnify:CR=1 FL=1